jgi:hypothetical protein
MRLTRRPLCPKSPGRGRQLLLIVALIGLLGGAAAQADTSGTWKGTLRVTHLDRFEAGESEIIYQLVESGTEQVYDLRFEVSPPDPGDDGRGITVKGTLAKRTITVSDYTLAPPEPAAEQKDGLNVYDTAVVLFDFELDDGTPVPIGCSADYVDDLMFSDPDDHSVDDLYVETTYGRIGLSGDVYGPLTIPYYEYDHPNAYTRCSRSSAEWVSSGYDALEDAQIDVSGYDRRVFVFAEPNVCSEDGYGGLASWSMARIFKCVSPAIYAHELGHTFGFGHAACYVDGGLNSYCDASDIMGAVWYQGGWLGLRGFNAPHKDYKGWLDDAVVLDNPDCGVYELSALEIDPSEAVGAHAILLDKPDTGDSYYLSYRGAVGFDANVPDEWRDKLNVHRDNGGYLTIYISTHDVGESFFDEELGYQATLLARDSDSATVELLVDRGLRQTTAEMVPELQTGAPGLSRDYELTVTNNDCLEQSYVTEYEIRAAVPAEIDVTFAPQTLSLAPGESGTVYITATATDAAGEGTYRLLFNVDGGKTIHQATAEAQYIIDYGPPTAPTNLQGFGGEPPVFLRWGASSDPGAGVDHYVVFRNGAYRAETDATSYYDRNVTPGSSYTYKVKAVDRLGKESGFSNEVTVEVTGDPPPHPHEDPVDGGR